MFGLLGSLALAAYATGGPTATQPQTAREEEPYSPWVCDLAIFIVPGHFHGALVLVRRSSTRA